MAKTHLLFVGLVCVLIFAGCKTGSASDGGSSTPLPPNAQTADFASVVNKAVAAGQMPSLDTTSSLTGTDANKDGIRDDIAVYVAKQPDDSGKKQSLLQLARALNNTLSVQITDSAATTAASNSIIRAVNCIDSTYNDIDLSGIRLKELQRYTFNTPERFKAYERFNQAVSGYAGIDQETGNCDT